MLVAPGVPEPAERELMKEICQMYGKVIHTWQVDLHPLPIGPPKLMMSVTRRELVRQELMKQKEKLTGISSEERAEKRKGIECGEKAEGADAWEQEGLGVQFAPIYVELRPPVLADQATFSKPKAK
jgi:hypothetical protein